MLTEIADVPVPGVRIWMAELDRVSPAEAARLQGLLDATECARARRFHFERDRSRYIVARGLVRWLLGGALNEPAATLAFEYGRHGKPRLAHDPEREKRLHFNLSHSEGRALFALSFGREVGVDLEATTRLKRTNELVELAARVLSPRELAVWRELPGDMSRRSAFVRAWTRKEAYAKATGRAMLDDFWNIELALDAAAPEASIVFTPPSSDERWSVYDLSVPNEFAGALAIREGVDAQG